MLKWDLEQKYECSLTDRPTPGSRQVMQIHARQNEVEEGGLLPCSGDVQISLVQFEMS
jgi:hypothetical protein